MSEVLKDEYKLTEKQKQVYNLMATGQNVFITGPSGVGKSSVIKMFCRNYGYKKKIAMTSTTGISALLIGGVTLHSYLGIGLGTASVDTLVEKINSKSYLKKRWNELDTLIIDEVSMLSPVLFDKLEDIACRVRLGRGKSFLSQEKPAPFGGIQLILSGDMLQLPVVKSNDFCFEADSWKYCVHNTIQLTEIIRQEDIEFQTVLNKIRFGIVDDEVKKVLEECKQRELTNDNGIKPTRLHTTNYNVDQINEQELDELSLDERQFYSYDMTIEMYKFVKNKEYVLDKFRRDCIAPEHIELCVDAQVMLLYNMDIDAGLANGSRGVVINFINDMPQVRFMNGEERVIGYHDWEYEEDGRKFIKLTQIPLKLAYAITTHKGQGCTLDYAEIDLSNVFEYGQAYVALSRVKCKEGLKILNIDYTKIRAHPKAIEFYKNNK